MLRARFGYLVVPLVANATVLCYKYNLMSRQADSGRGVVIDRCEVCAKTPALKLGQLQIQSLVLAHRYWYMSGVLCATCGLRLHDEVWSYNKKWVWWSAVWPYRLLDLLHNRENYRVFKKKLARIGRE